MERQTYGITPDGQQQLVLIEAVDENGQTYLKKRSNMPVKSPSQKVPKQKAKSPRNKNRSKSNNQHEEFESVPQYSQSPLAIPNGLADIN